MNKFFQFSEFVELGKVFNDCEAYLIALEYFNRAISLSYLPINKERLVEAYELRGIVKVSLSKYWESIADFSRAIELDPKNSSLYFSRGMSFEYLNQNEEALKNLKVSLILDPGNSLALSIVNDLENKKDC
tara:strand:- start:1115 stop:1507 length:393 start_codon:yes stop_codon:yes gene_type:complete